MSRTIPRKINQGGGEKKKRSGSDRDALGGQAAAGGHVTEYPNKYCNPDTIVGNKEYEENEAVS